MLADGANGKLLERIGEGAPVGAGGAGVPARTHRRGRADGARRRPGERPAAFRQLRRGRRVPVPGRRAAGPAGCCGDGARPSGGVDATPAGHRPRRVVRRDAGPGPVLAAPAGFDRPGRGCSPPPGCGRRRTWWACCQAALALAVRRATTRRQFGQPIGRFQAPAFALAAAATRIEGACWLVRATAWEADQGADIRLRGGAGTGDWRPISAGPRCRPPASCTVRPA